VINLPEINILNLLILYDNSNTGFKIISTDKSVPIKRIGIKSKEQWGLLKNISVPTCRGRERGKEKLVYIITFLLFY
jgi:hypothetical protein